MLINSLKIILLSLLAITVNAAPIDDYQEGKNLAEKLQTNIPQPNAGKVPIYTREPAKQAQWQGNTSLDEKNLNSAATSQLSTEPVAETLINTNNQRPRIQKLKESPLVKNGIFLENHAAEILEVKGKAFTQKHNRITKVTCEASRDAEKFQCIRYLKPPIVKITPEVKTQRQCWRCGGHEEKIWHGRDDYSYGTGYCKNDSWDYKGRARPCKNKQYYTVTDITPRKIDITPDEWVSDCQHLETRVGLNECKLIKTECLDNKPKIIEGETITRACWKYQDTYSCQYPCLNNCSRYLEQGCKHVGSECKLKVKDKCYIWQQFLDCPDQTIQEVTNVENANWFGINGECGGVSFMPNNEFASSIAELSVFGELQKEVQGGLNNLFKGQNNQCRKTGFGIKDCCEKMGGWGVNFKLTGCNEEEQLLAEKRHHNLCHEVGTYKVGKEVLVIPKKKTSFCCFTSKLARVLHEQGRAQLGIGWGDAEHPNCRGFTVEELSRLNFERMNLSELFADVMQKVKPVDANKLNIQVQDQFKLLESGSVKQEDRKDA